MDIFHNFFYVPIFNLLMVLYQLLSENLGLAIIAVALIAKLITYPLSRKQIQSAQKSREFQKKSNEIRKKHKNDQEQLAKELAKIQAEFLPGQLGGCLNLILVIILLIQVRNVVINLVNQGVHAFNQVAYTESLKFPEDSVGFDLPEGFEYGIHEVDYKITASNGSVLNKEIVFGVAENEDQERELIDELKKRQDELSDEERQAQEQEAADERKSSIALYIEEFEGDNVIIGRDQEIKAFLRPPSNETIDYSNIEVFLDDQVVEGLGISEGSTLNFRFLGADLSKVATDVGFDDLGAVAPYVVIAVAVGITQFFASRIQSGFSAIPGTDDEEKKEKEKKAKSKSKQKGDSEEPDFAEMMQASTKQMMFIFPLLTITMSLGFFGGATFFPTGVSVFWTGQSAFVIIEQLISNRQQVVSKLKSKISKDER